MVQIQPNSCQVDGPRVGVISGNLHGDPQVVACGGTWMVPVDNVLGGRFAGVVEISSGLRRLLSASVKSLQELQALVVCGIAFMNAHDP